MSYLASSALLAVLFGAAGSGTAVMPVLRIEQGPRLAAMGGAGIALVGDASAIYWNPAGLARVSGTSFALSHQQWFAGIKDEVLHAALPSGLGAIGLGLTYSGEPGIEFWDHNNFPGDTFSTWNGVLTAGYGFAVAKDWHVGAAVKSFYQSLYTSGGYGGACDIGFACRPLPFLSLGAVARNLGVAMYGPGLEQMPIEAGVGGGFALGPANVVLDFVLPIDNGVSLRAGVEYKPIPELALRLGYRTGPQDLGTLGALSGLTAGLGVGVGPFSLDYAIDPYGKLGLSHRIGLATALSARGAGSLRLKVVDGTSMDPLSAAVTTTGTKSYQGRTGISGEVMLTRLPAGELVIYTSRQGYLPRVDSMYIAGDREQSATIALSPLTYGAITGVIADAETRKPIGGRVAYSGAVQGSTGADSMLGNYTLRSLPAGQYRLTASGPTDDYVAQTCSMRVEPGRITTKDFYLVRRRQTIVLHGVNFETGKAALLPEFDSILARAGEILSMNPGIMVELAGHTDPREIATTEYPSNWELSQARAEAVRQYLVIKWGIAPERLTSHGYADTQPIAPNNTEEGMARNRRTEFRIAGQQ
ncbi:PorV/PorQ family protein [candidate division WOR-3 bacterium]|uniref:PorV/PorQ family protein n=1 Tax=candidate division WOR-3 bacterium TaxID=2052148 RepID=A0A937XBE1_UNCW3|nr:PorV/PorQ family protein [candidate division WOR-3 bacterium]